MYPGAPIRRTLPAAGTLLFLALPLLSAQFTVSADGSADFRTVQAAVDAAPPTGAVIRIRPATYHEAISIDKSHIQLRGLGSDPKQVVLSFDNSAGTAGGTGKSQSVAVNGDDFYAENLTIENTFSRGRPLTQQGSQAVALRVRGDRAVFRHIRLLGYQDTLYADGKGCDSEQGPCRPARQYFADCYIEGNVDFIFGDAVAFFDRCELHALAHPVVEITAQSKRYDGERSGYVFDHCRITAEPGAAKVFLGRPWRSHASVVFLNTEMPSEVQPAGWSEWKHGDADSLPTSFYAEYRSSGPGANPQARDPHSKQLTAAEAAKFALSAWMSGDDGWNPENVK
jgi:pectin methylesterase-like acyl-CoA thioesterase